MDDLYVLARRVLLDALDCLSEHRESLVLVGAQAIYLRLGDVDFAVAPYTTDGDLAVDPELLAENPPLEQALSDAGFVPSTHDSVGIWVAARHDRDGRPRNVSIDLLVPDSLSPGSGRRDAGLLGHARRTARKVRGLEGALVDADRMRIPSLEDSDTRSHEIMVAGPAALLIAKLHKIEDRRAGARASDKDALDVFRILRDSDTRDVAERYRRILGDGRSRGSGEHALLLVRDQFMQNGLGIEMAARAASPLIDAAEIAAVCDALAGDLLDELGPKNLDAPG